MEGLIELVITGIIIAGIVVLTNLRKVPANTTIIIDRNSHFHKKKKHGYYFFNSTTDKITTQVSLYPITEQYINVFKTHEDKYYQVKFSMTYVCKEPEQTLDSLADSRRSIYDIANCAVETLWATLSQKDITTTVLEEMSQRLFHQLESTLEYFYIDVTEAHIINYSLINEDVGRDIIFQKHISSSNEPIQ